MELTAEIFIFYMIISGVLAMLLTPLIFEFYAKRRLIPKVKEEFKGADQFLDLASVYLTDSDNEEVIESTFNAITQLGTLATNANAILDDEEAFNAILTTIAQRGFKIAKMSMMGTASGDVKKLAVAERIVHEGMIKGIQELSPAIKIMFKITGLEEEFAKDPELFPLVMQVIMNNEGLMNMLSGFMGSQNAGILQGTQAQENLMREKLGIDF